MPPMSSRASRRPLPPRSRKRQNRRSEQGSLRENDAMSALRVVSAEHAGPEAIGILVPPGARTVLIVRPRALAWDLLLVRGVAGTTFRELSRDEAPAVAREFLAALERWSRGGIGHVEAVAASGGEGHLVWVDVEEF